VEPSQYIDAIEREARAMAAAIDAGRHAAIAACPGWDVAALTIHMGYVFRWASEIVRTQATQPPTGEWTFGADDPGLADWLLEGAEELARVLQSTDLDAPLWTMGPPRTARFWCRRQAIEALIHRWDCEAATLPVANPLESQLAADGVGELVEVLAPRQHRRSGHKGAGETYHFHRTDGPGEWFLRFDADRLEVSAEHAKADVALRGSAADLLLVLWRRQPADTVEVFGDRAALGRWYELVPAL
jgi:uncharacterized protein (TIGR03083 family)